MKWIVNLRMRRVELIEEIVGTEGKGSFGVYKSYKVGKATYRFYDGEAFDSVEKALEHLLEKLDIRLYDMREKFDKLRGEYEALEEVLAKVKAAQ